MSPDFKFYYVDEDEDEILLLNDSDLKAAIEYARNNGNALKVFMKGEVQEEVKEEVPLAESRISQLEEVDSEDDENRANPDLMPDLGKSVACFEIKHKPSIKAGVPDAPLAVVHEGDDPTFVKNEGEEQKVPMVKKAFNKVLFNLGNSKRRTQIAEVNKTGDEFSSDHVLTGAPGEVVKRSWIV